MNINIIANNIRSIFTNRIIILTTMAFILLFTFQFKLTHEFNPNNLFEYIKYCFYGVNTISENISALFAWSIFQLFFIMIMVSFLTTEFHGRNIYFISRVGNKKSWFFSLELTIIISGMIFFLIGFITITICSVIISKDILFTPNFTDILFILIVLFLNSCFYVNLYLLMSLKFNHSTSSVLLITLLIFFFIDLGNKLQLDLYNPFTQCIMLKHYINNISFSNSIVLLLISNSLISLYLYCNIIKKDLLNITI